MQRLRDNPACADQEHQAKQDEQDPGLNVKLTFAPEEDIAAPYIARALARKWRCCASRVNSHVEMAAAFHRAGFDAVDVHMSDLLAGRRDLQDFHTLVACGGSYGDVRAPAKVGRSLSCSTSGCATSSKRSSTVRRRWRWACATAAR